MRVRILLPLPSKEDEKDILTENPDFIGVFAVSGGDFSRVRFVDVKWAFSLFGEIRTHIKRNIVKLRQIEIKSYLPFLLSERKSQMKEVYKIKSPERVVFGEPMYFQQCKSKKLTLLTVDYKPPSWMIRRQKENRVAMHQLPSPCIEEL